MTVEIQTNYVIHTGNGVATQFPYTFRIPEISMVVVSLLDATTNDVVQVLTYGVDFNITGVSQDNYDGGEVEYPLTGSPMPATNKLLILRTVPLTQGLDLENQGGFYPESVEYQLDKLEFQIQQLNTNVSQTMQFPLGIPPIDPQALIDAADDAEAAANRAEAAAGSVAIKYAADDDALKAFTGVNDKAIFNLANEGWWLPTSDDISAEITAGDPRYLPTSGDATGENGGWYQAGSIASGKKYANQGARIERIADRVMIGGEAVKFNGLPDGGGGKGGFLWDYLTDEATLTHGWMEQQALLSVGGLYNVDGAVSLNTYLAGPGVALNVHLLHDRSGDVNAASGAWAFYIDARRDLEFGTTWGCELDVINALPSPHTAYGPWGGNGATALGRTTGMQISGGGGPEINGTTYPVDVALLIQKNSTGFYTGISFGGQSLEPDTGTGRMHAIALAPKQAIDWWGDSVANGILASIVSNATSSATPQELRFENGGLSLLGGGNPLFHVDAVADAATYINIHPTGSGGSPAIGAAGTASNISLALRSKGAATSTYLQSDTIATFSATGVASGVNRLDALAAITGSAVQLRALGTDTNIDLQLTPKGSGNVRMGTHTALGSETVTGYITIKDAGGTVRKLAVVS